MNESVPRIVWGRVGHTRFRPVMHRFKTRAFYLQLPLRSMQKKALREEPFADGAGFLWAINRSALLSVWSKDHGDGRPLLAWAESQLQAAGMDDADGEIWLTTFPRVLGYAFKPVSFWFCERGDGSLSAVIVEVNNTFQGRHVYVLRPGDRYANGQTLYADKAFYVSPFFEVKGHYAFRFYRSPTVGGQDLARIDYSSEPGPSETFGSPTKSLDLTTYLSGRSRPLNRFTAFLAWLSFPAFSLKVIVQIHWHALQLWLKGCRLVPRT